jgi:ATP-dependent DNA helicase DinG
MATLFARRAEKSVLIGLIDTWQNEYTLWENTDEVIIVKIPFDPPTDPYYLARTVGMKNNFEEYSMPTALSGIESLLTKILMANENITVSLFDERISTTNWGQVFRENIAPFIIMK